MFMFIIVIITCKWIGIFLADDPVIGLWPLDAIEIWLMCYSCQKKRRRRNVSQLMKRDTLEQN